MFPPSRLKAALLLAHPLFLNAEPAAAEPLSVTLRTQDWKESFSILKVRTASCCASQHIAISLIC
jgi:hypothetical protein